MYLTVKQQIKHLSKADYKSIKKLSHIAKNLANQAIYNIRQYYFKMKKSNVVSLNGLYSRVAHL